MTEAPEHAHDLIRSPLHDRHLALGAKMGEFGGWTMPLEYAGGGVIAEHKAVRENVGVFDVSHLGKASVRGPGAAAFINATLTNDLDRIAADGAQYTHGARGAQYTHGARGAQYTLCADDASGGVVDDLIVYLRSDDDVFLVPNAANTAEVVRRLSAAAPHGVDVRNLHRDFAVLAVQGPRSPELVEAIGLPAEHPYMSFVDAGWTPDAGVSTDITVCRSGYTGERGYELVVASDAAGAVWDQLFAAGAPSASGLAVLVLVTRCAPKWATRCTARTSPSTSPRTRRALAGRSAGRSRHSGGATSCWPSGPPGRPASCVVSCHSTGASRDRTWW